MNSHYETFKDRMPQLMPWTYAGASDAEKARQTAWHARLRAETNCELHETAFVSREAIILYDRLTLGEGSWIAANCLVRGKVEMGDHSTLNCGAITIGKVKIGNCVRVAANAQFMGFNHGHARTDIPIYRQECTEKGIVIEDDVWVGANCVICDGVTVGAHSIIAAGTVVTKDIAPYSVVGGVPAKFLKSRLPSPPPAPTPAPATAPATSAATPSPGSLGDTLETFARQAKLQVHDVIAAHSRRDGDDLVFTNGSTGEADIISACAAVEYAALFDTTPGGLPAKHLAEKLQTYQDNTTGLFIDPADRHAAASAPKLDFNILAVGYALEVLGEKLKSPITAAAAISPAELLSTLQNLTFKEKAWAAGSWVDEYATALYLNLRHHDADPSPLYTLFGWLNAHCDPFTGVWGGPTADEGWRQPINGFYRLTRGTYAQFGQKLPHPEPAIDSILAYARDRRFFSETQGTCCDVLDVAHPLWLCLQQTDYRKKEAQAVAATMLQRALGRWTDGKGMSFTLEPTGGPYAIPNLKYTEQWLSAIYYLAAVTGCEDRLGYKPRGLHRPEVALALRPV
jgi:acetyltransferase-like isoleucine patch superfamily enzyme